jgi:hypothetical protein
VDHVTVDIKTENFALLKTGVQWCNNTAKTVLQYIAILPKRIAIRIVVYMF